MLSTSSENLPDSFSPALTLHLLHIDQKTLEELRASGLIPAGRQGRISRDAIEALLGRAVTASEIVTADAKLEPRRATQRRYHEKWRSRAAVSDGGKP
jgi:hypothetical protein